MWVKVCDAMLAKAVESFKTVTQILVTRHASVNLKMVKPWLISWWIQKNIFWRRLSDSCSTAWQANVWLEAARPRGRCCTWNARRIRGEGFRAALYHVLCCVKNVKITTTTGNVTTRSKHVLEEFCYCSYDLCNSAGPSHAPAPRGWSLAALVLALHWAPAAGTRIMSSLL